MAKRPKPVPIVTPFGRAGFCALARPSTTYKPDGEYSARILLDDTPETQALIAQLDDLYEAAYNTNLEEVRKDKPRVAEIKRADRPYKRQEDPDTGELLPGYVLNARVGAIVRGKSPGKDGNGNPLPGPKLYERRPQVVDAKGHSLLKGGQMTEVGSGSTIRLSIDVKPFYVPALGSGLSLGLVGVQVTDLVPPGMRDAQFSEVDGYTVSEATASDPVETTHAPEPEVPAVDSVGDVPTEW